MSDPVYLFVQLQTDMINEKVVEQTLALLRKNSYQENGCSYYEYSKDVATSTFFLLETWTDESCLSLHEQADHFLESTAILNKLCSNIQLFRLKQALVI